MSAVKVLDFGLAKAMESAPGSSPGMSQSPTITSPAMMTGVGMILGTAAYMSPEQARGKAVDKRSDIWAFGCVLFEMLTGRRAFGGDDVQDTFVAIMRDDPDWARLPATLSPALGTYIRRCLHKNPKQRIADVQDIRLALEGAFEVAAPKATDALPSSAPRGRLSWMAFAVAVLVAAALAIPAVRYLRETQPVPPETRVDIVTPGTSEPASFALSPDGRQIVFVASGDGASRLWLRPLTSTTAQPLAGTDGATYPFWSADGRSVGFFANGELKRIDLGAGAPQTLASAPIGRGGTWNADGTILFAPNGTGPLSRIAASGGAPRLVTKLDGQTAHRFPLFLPDGRHFLFHALGGRDTTGIFLGSLDSTETQRLTAADRQGVYLPSGWMLWVREGTLIAQYLDLERRTLSGDPVTLVDPVPVDLRTGANAMSASTTGLIAYRTGEANRWQLVWFDRSGKALGSMDEPAGNFMNIELAPDGLRVAADRILQGNRDVWLIAGGRSTRFTFDAGSDMTPHWSPDERRIVFASNRQGAWNLYQKLSSGAGNDELLVGSPLSKRPTDWSSDGRFLMYVIQDPKTDADLWVLPTGGDRKAFAFLNASVAETQGQFSPDSRWVAYQSNESGRQEIFVRPFPARAGQWQISTSGGIQARWGRDGKELYYIDPAGNVMAVPITIKDDSIEPGAPVPLFQTRIWGGGTSNIHPQFAVTGDGRFLINTVLDHSSAITLIQNWQPPSRKP